MAVKLWSKALFYEALKETYAQRFMGTSANSLCQILDDTQKQAGDKITWGLRRQLTGRGVQGDNDLEGNEEALTFHNDAVIIDQLRHAVRSQGRMSEQRVPYPIREEARQGLTDWYADRIDSWFFNQLCGYTDQADTAYTGNQATLSPDANHIFISSGSGGAEGSLSATASNFFRLRDIDRCVAIAKAGTIPIRPILIDGQERYVIFIHPYTTYQLRIDATNNFGPGWEQIQIAAMQGGQVSGNPIFTGALGMYNNTVIHESTRVTPSTTFASGKGPATDYRRNVFCGAQAAALAFGQGFGPSKMSWVEKKFDYDNQLGVSAGLIAGLKKSQFTIAGTATDFATIVCTSYSPAVTT